MRKFLKSKSFGKIFIYLFIFLYTFLPPMRTIGITLEKNAQENIKIDESEDILDEGISDPEWIAKPLFTFEDGVYTVSYTHLYSPLCR